MSDLQRVVWTEGMFLTPHHLQHAERFAESLLHHRLNALDPLGWGLTDLRFNEEALANGEFVLTRAAGVMPDGLAFDVPDADDPPQARPVGASFEAKTERLGVFLAAPLARAGGVSCSPEGTADGRPTRYRRRLATMGDANTGSNERQIEVAAPNLRILFEGEPLDDYVTIRIAEIGRTATGAFTPVEAYIPPCLYLSASPALLTIVRRVVEILSTKSADLAKSRRQRSQGLVEFTMSEAANFWFLHTVNGFIPPLMHYFQRPQVHPERVYLEIGRLVGELVTFASEGHPKEVPVYAHDALSATFGELERKLKLLLETVIPTRCTPIPLERTRDSLFTGRVGDERLLEAAQFYLAVMASVPEEKIVREVPLKAKITSLDRVDRLIAAALRGLALKHLPTPPAEIPVQPGRSYFQVDRSGEHWEAVKGSRTLSIYLPPEFTALKLELMAVKE